MLITATSIQQQDHRDMASSEAEIDIKQGLFYDVVFFFVSKRWCSQHFSLS